MASRGAQLKGAVPLVAPGTFLAATRDTGYRSLSAAVSELVDNSLEAGARRIRIFVRELGIEHPEVMIGVLDDGVGMPEMTLRCALQFGGTSRFGSRRGLGRFGMGLPNSSVSQTRRLEVYTWVRPSEVLTTYLDVDEIVSGRLLGLPPPRPSKLPDWIPTDVSRSGTLVLWTRCDRLGRYRIDTLIQRLQRSLGRIFRFYLWQGVQISVNDANVRPFDPLFLNTKADVHGARLYGSPLRYEVQLERGSSAVEVRFTELPVLRWHRWTAEEKRRRGIVGGAGVSFVRAGREIDYGWQLLGGKRRENYDEWWRCEIRFTPELDELFGVTHSKQGVNPRAELRGLMAADLEATARTLNRRARSAFETAKSNAHESRASRNASQRDILLTPPPAISSRTIAAGGLRYHLKYDSLSTPEFYTVRVARQVVEVTVNTDHPFFTEMYRSASSPPGCALDRLDSLVLAAARADLECRTPDERDHVARRRRAWSDALAAFLTR